jgi:hypothetical protein
VACGGASFVTTVVRRISVPPNSFALILTKGQEETNRLYWENSRKHESTRRERKLPPGPRRKPIAAGHAFVDVYFAEISGFATLGPARHTLGQAAEDAASEQLNLRVRSMAEISMVVTSIAPLIQPLFGVLRRLHRCQRQEAASKDLVESRTL